jgi:hypothetical protein
MRIVYLPFRLLWKLLTMSKMLILVTLFTLSLLLNIAQFTGHALSTMFETAIKLTTGLTSVASKATARATKATTTATRLTSQVSTLKKSKAVLENSIRSTSKKLSVRAGLRGARVLAAGATQAAGSWVPYLGTATGAAFISYEAYDLCQSFKEIHELEKLVNLSTTKDDYVFCGYDFSDSSKPTVSGLNSKSFNGQEFKKIWFDVPISIKAQHNSLFGADYDSETEHYFFIESSEDGKQTRTWLVDLDYGPDDFYVSEWKARSE